MISPRIARLALIAAIVAGSAAPSINVVAIRQWLPVTDEERNLKAPKIDPEAGAEALFWRVHIVDQFQGEDPQTVLYHYLRIKVFNQRGGEAQGTQDIPYSGKRTIVDVGGRTIKPDGTIVELSKDAVFRRDIVKAGGVKVKVVSFAMPAVEPGAILEYHWKEIRDGELANYVRMPFQRDIPVHEITYFIKPLDIPWLRLPMRVATFGAQPGKMIDGRDGFHSTSVKNVPAFKEEPLMPSEWYVKPWVLLYYEDDVKTSPEKFWASEGKKLYSRFEPYLKVSGEVRQAADEAVAGATTPEEKLAKMVQYCRTKVRMFGDEGVTQQQLQKAKENNKPSDTLKRAIGTGEDLNLLFAAMARAQGFEARMALLGDRSDRPFDRNFLNTYFLNAADIAVKVGDQWRFYDVAAKRLPVGMLRWQEEGSAALISDPKEPIFVQVPFSDVDKSVRSRTGTFEMDADGTLEGEVRLAYTGHVAASWRRDQVKEGAAQREDDVRDLVRGQYSNAEVSEVKVENVENPEKPLLFSYRVKVPGYGQRTGKRLFLPLDYFEHGRSVRFPASERKYPVWFEYPWTDDDSITIKPPAGFNLENAEAPNSFGLGEVGTYDVSAKFVNQQVVYHRKLEFGRKGALAYPVSAYPLLKKAFDDIHTQDEHTLTLRQQAAGQ